ncbi:response regulator [Labrys wisconsinensis]|uniref:CheY-like chemotaxis protein n=1 Tax=Labrys wisconsinensis TaxID=425677 RepID=A0ABU0JL29_9HYPH|nr:response regulator [Labrys wisconsinensis]MDQ0474997.1 CheY-like chemotaxis protein [Labrys wisconsinensis]
MSEDESAIAGVRILIVEDEALLSLLLEDMVQDLGCTVAGNLSSLEAARGFLAAAPGPIDLAILDVNLGGTPSYPIAAMLDERGIPFLFVTGYDERDIDEAWRDRPRISKPFNVPDLEHAIARVAGRA